MSRCIAILFLIFSVPALSFGQRVVRKGVTSNKKTQTSKAEKYSPELFRGKWQEVKRVGADKRSMDFTDTLFLNFFKRDSVITRNGGMEMSQKGLVQVEGNQAFFAGDDYTIVRFQNNLILDDGVSIRTLEKREAFYSDSLGLVKIPVDNIKDPITIVAKNLVGKWHVYRTQSIPGESVPDSTLVRNIEFKEAGNGKDPVGIIGVQKKGAMETLPFEAIIRDKEMEIRTKSEVWNLRVYKLTSKEFVFGNMGGLVYFAKQF